MFVNTGQEFDGSDSGARPDEAVSWGKIRTDAKPVKVSIFIPAVLAMSVLCSTYYSYVLRYPFIRSYFEMSSLSHNIVDWCLSHSHPASG